MQDKGRAIFYGAVLILIGVWLLLRTLGVPLVGWSVIWPALLIMGALASLYNGLRSAPRNTGGIWFGVTGTLCGLLFLYLGAGYGEWKDLAMWWPWFPTAAGVGWLAAWIAQPRELVNLAMGLAALLAGGFGFLYTLGVLSPGVAVWLAHWWPLLLVGVGVTYIIQYFLQRQ